MSSKVFSSGAPHLGNHAGAAGAFVRVSALPQAKSPSPAHNDAWFIFTALCILLCHWIRFTAESWHPDTILFVYFWISIHLFALSLFFSLWKGNQRLCWIKPLLIQKIIVGMHQSIHDSDGGWGGMLNWAFSAKLSKQNTQMNMSAYCTGGKPAHRCCCLVLKHHLEC